MKEILISFATAMTKKDIVEELQDQTQKFILTNGENNQQLGFMCMLYLVHENTNGELKQAKDLLQKWNEHEKITDLFNIQKN